MIKFDEHEHATAKSDLINEAQMLLAILEQMAIEAPDASARRFWRECANELGAKLAGWKAVKPPLN